MACADKYSREYVASYPHGVLAFRLSAREQGKLDVEVSLSRAQSVLAQSASVEDGTGVISLSGNSGQSSDAITFWSEARVINSGGAYYRELMEEDACDVVQPINLLQALLLRTARPFP